MHPDAPIKTTCFNVANEFQHLTVDDLKVLANARRLNYAVALANITGDLNAGVIIRSACVLGAQRVFIFGKRKYDRRSTVGAHNYIDITHYEAFNESELFDWTMALHTIRVNGYTPVIIEQGGLPLYDMKVEDIPSPLCLVFGAEDTGIPSEVCTSELCYTIPQPGIVRSLNVSSAAAIAMWHTMCGLMQTPDLETF